MLFTFLNILLLSNAVTARKDKSIYFSQNTFIIIIYSLFLTYLIFNFNLNEQFFCSVIELFNGLLYYELHTLTFILFIYCISGIILLFTSFHKKKEVIFYKPNQKDTLLEYPLIILFVLLGGIILLSSSHYLTLIISFFFISYGIYLHSILFDYITRIQNGKKKWKEEKSLVTICLFITLLIIRIFMQNISIRIDLEDFRFYYIIIKTFSFICITRFIMSYYTKDNHWFFKSLVQCGISLFIILLIYIFSSHIHYYVLNIVSNVFIVFNLCNSLNVHLESVMNLAMMGPPGINTPDSTSGPLNSGGTGTGIGTGIGIDTSTGRGGSALNTTQLGKRKRLPALAPGPAPIPAPAQDLAPVLTPDPSNTIRSGVKRLRTHDPSNTIQSGVKRLRTLAPAPVPALSDSDESDSAGLYTAPGTTPPPSGTGVSGSTGSSLIPSTAPVSSNIGVSGSAGSPSAPVPSSIGVSDSTGSSSAPVPLSIGVSDSTGSSSAPVPLSIGVSDSTGSSSAPVPSDFGTGINLWSEETLKGFKYSDMHHNDRVRLIENRFKYNMYKEKCLSNHSKECSLDADEWKDFISVINLLDTANKRFPLPHSMFNGDPNIDKEIFLGFTNPKDLANNRYIYFLDQYKEWKNKSDTCFKEWKQAKETYIQTHETYIHIEENPTIRELTAKYYTALRTKERSEKLSDYYKELKEGFNK